MSARAVKHCSPCSHRKLAITSSSKLNKIPPCVIFRNPACSFFGTKSQTDENIILGEIRQIMKKNKRTEEDFSETLALINKYKAVEATFKKAEYFVNVSFDALAIYPDSEDKRILQNLTSFSLNRSF